MARLSSPIETLKEHYAVVVIGSGYGAAIAASRLARAGKQVCVLERGREFQPGEYPNRSTEAVAEMQAHSPEIPQFGSRTGLFDFHIHPDINVFVGCGLGGTSLVNANVALRAEPRVFDDPRWPLELRNPKPVDQNLEIDHATPLEDSYARAEEMLKPNPYPQSEPDASQTLAPCRSPPSIWARSSTGRPSTSTSLSKARTTSGWSSTNARIAVIVLRVATTQPKTP